MKSEKQVQTEILEWLRSQGYYVIKTIRSNDTGIPDIIGCADGLFFAIEVKREDLGYEDATPKQKLHIRKILEAGGIAFVASSLEEVIANLILL